MNVYIKTYGCQMNERDSESAAAMLVSAGHHIVNSEQDADIIILNTCSVREQAERKAIGKLGILKKLKREHPHMIFGIMGCMAQSRGEELLKSVEHLDFAVGTDNIHAIPEIVEDVIREKHKIRRDDRKGADTPGIDAHRVNAEAGQFNAFISISRGCNRYCSYCIVPYVRGRERSRESGAIVKEVNALLDQGYKEITLLGQNVNSYGNDRGDCTFWQLLNKICERKEKFRLRFMTSNPKDFGEDLVRTIAENEQICHLVHLPVQAGSDRILKLMNRKYTAKEYLEKVEMLRKYVPDCQLTTDIMVGFPTETEEDFQATLSLVKEARFSTAFTFVYSRRSGTVAAGMEGQIPEEVQKDRIMRLVELVNVQTREISAAYRGKTIEVLCEDYDAKRGLYLGRDEYGRMGYFKSETNKVGDFVKLKVSDTSGVSLDCELCEDTKE